MPTDDINYLLDTIIEVIPRLRQLEGTPQMLITSLDYSAPTQAVSPWVVYTAARSREGMNVTICHRDGTPGEDQDQGAAHLRGYGPRRRPIRVSSGDICAIIGLGEVRDWRHHLRFRESGAAASHRYRRAYDEHALHHQRLALLRQGGQVLSPHATSQDRLQKELEKNLALRVTPGDSADKWIVFGRGVLHLSVLIETMRREGYELQVGQPQVIVQGDRRRSANRSRSLR